MSSVEEHLRTELQAAQERIEALRGMLDLRPMEQMPQTGEPFNVVSSWTHRWLPYKGNSQQFKKGIKGRWQRAVEYGWENCEKPDADGWKPLKEMTS